MYIFVNFFKLLMRIFWGGCFFEFLFFCWFILYFGVLFFEFFLVLKFLFGGIFKFFGGIFYFLGGIFFHIYDVLVKPNVPLTHPQIKLWPRLHPVWDKNRFLRPIMALTPSFYRVSISAADFTTLFFRLFICYWKTNGLYDTSTEKCCKIFIKYDAHETGVWIKNRSFQMREWSPIPLQCVLTIARICLVG